MKMNFTKRLIAPLSLAILVLLGVNNKASAQGEFVNFLRAGAADGSKLMDSYTEPFFKGFGVGMNAGWVNTARPHKILGFDLTVTPIISLVPEVDRTFQFIASEYSVMELQSGAPSAVLPTMFGPADAGTEMLSVTYNDPEFNQPVTSRFESPASIRDALNFSAFDQYNPVPNLMITGGIGLIKGTEIRFRYFPEYDIADGFSYGLFGIGVKHDIKQWIPVVKNLPFDLSVFLGTTRMNVEMALDSDELSDGTIENFDNSEQKAEFKVNSTVFQALVSKKLLFFTPYAGFGYGRSSSSLAIKGNYRITLEEGPYSFTNDLVDPVNLDGSVGSFQALIGFKIKILWVLSFNVDYTLQKYNTLSAGVGLDIR